MKAALLARLRQARHALHGDAGAATVLLALVLPTVLLMQSLVVDVTMAFHERRQLQNTADAAALAAATYLPTTDPAVLARAIDAAVAIGAVNGTTIEPGDVTFTTRVTPYDLAVVAVRGSVPFAFTRPMGFSFGAVSAQGGAQLGSLSARTGVMPWGVEPPTGGFRFGVEYCLKLAANNDRDCAQAQQGNFHAIDVDDSHTDSANIYKALIISGSHTLVQVGTVKNVVSGNMVGPTQQGTGCTGNSGRISGNTETFEQVIDADADDTYRVLDWTSPRIVVVPTIHVIDAGHVRVTGFGVFFIDRCTAHGGVLGRFIDTVVPGGVWGSYLPGYGSRVVRLVQ